MNESAFGVKHYSRIEKKCVVPLLVKPDFKKTKEKKTATFHKEKK